MDNLRCAIGASFHKEDTLAPVTQRRVPFRHIVTTRFGQTTKVVTIRPKRLVTLLRIHW